MSAGTFLRKIESHLLKKGRPTPRSRSVKRLLRQTRRGSFGRLPARLKVWMFNAAVAFTLALLFFWALRLIRPGEKINAGADIVAAFRAPYKAISLLEDSAYRNGVDFYEVFTLFCAENDFFPVKAVAYDFSALEQQYVVNAPQIKKKYNAKNLKAYTDMFATLFGELECFPIPAGFDGEEAVSYMYGDSWGIERNFEGDKSHIGMDILDRENIRGRIPVISMTGGAIKEAGWEDEKGYYALVETANGTRYLYAHLDSLAPTALPGRVITAGQLLGYMGDSGKGTFQVHLHIGISPKVSFAKNTKDGFWVNPYPLMRYLEDVKRNFGTVL